jgi:hypothetical protein
MKQITTHWCSKQQWLKYDTGKMNKFRFANSITWRQTNVAVKTTYILSLSVPEEEIIPCLYTKFDIDLRFYWHEKETHMFH